MSQVEKAFEFETEMNAEVAAEAPTEEVAVEAEPEVVETVEETVEPEVETTSTKKEDWTFSQAMDEREKRQKAVALAEKLQEKLDAYEKKPDDDISIFEDESAWKAKQDEKVQQDLRNVSLNMSQAFAEEQLGEDKVAAATKWMQDEGVKSPYIVNEFNNAKLPFHKLVKLYEAEQVRLDPESYKAELKAELLAEMKAEMSLEKKEEPETPIKPSLASGRSAGEPSKHPDDPNDILSD